MRKADKKKKMGYSETDRLVVNTEKEKAVEDDKDHSTRIKGKFSLLSD